MYVLTFVVMSISECYLVVLFFLFKQKTAYEMRISDWSSDVCPSDLRGGGVRRDEGRFLLEDVAENTRQARRTAQAVHRRLQSAQQRLEFVEGRDARVGLGNLVLEPVDRNALNRQRSLDDGSRVQAGKRAGQQRRVSKKGNCALCSRERHLFLLKPPRLPRDSLKTR